MPEAVHELRAPSRRGDDGARRPVHGDAPRPRGQGLAPGPLGVRDEVVFCECCFNISDQPLCPICRDPGREDGRLCVVEEPLDVLAIDRTGEYRGRYHVLHGAISPIDGIGPADLKIRELCLRLADGTVTEVIIATDPNLEGEATATYLSRLLLPLGVRVSRLASGLPVGGDLEYADEVTLGRAFEGRRFVEAS